MQHVGASVTGTIEVYSAGCVLCQDTLALLTQAAQGRASWVVERCIADTDVPGLRALPAIAFLDSVVFEGRPSPEQARALVKREELDRHILAHAIPKSEAMQRFARGEVQIDAAITLAREYYPVCLEFPLFLSAAISHVRHERTRLPGRRGRIVATHLLASYEGGGLGPHEGSQLLRLDNGDEATFLDGTCPCGLSSPRIRDIRRRGAAAAED